MSTADWLPSLWLDSFDDLLHEEEELDYGDQWSLHFSYSQTDEVTNEERNRGWRVYSHWAYGKFHCDSCSKCWTSVRVVVLFRYRLRIETGRGTVIMRPFGQACRRCRDDEFVLPGFSEEEVREPLLGLFGKIRKNCYGEENEEDDDDDDYDDDDDEDDDYDEDEDDDDEDDEDDEDGSVWPAWTRPHQKALCEACRHGICCQDN